MNDMMLDRLGTYFVHFNIGQRFGITFEEFLKIWHRGEWNV